jgi:hypothetical protein
MKTTYEHVKILSDTKHSSSSSEEPLSNNLNFLEMCPTEAFYHILGNNKRKKILYAMLVFQDFLKPIEIDRIIRRLNKKLREKASSSELWETRMLNRYDLMDLLYIELCKKYF